MNRGDTKSIPELTCLFLDIGGVLLTDGVDHNARKSAAAHFGFVAAEVEELQETK